MVYSYEETLRPYPLDPTQAERVARAERTANFCLVLYEKITNLAGASFAILGQAREEKNDEPGFSPPAIRKVSLNTPKNCVDQKFYFCLKEGRIWYKPIAAEKRAHWHLFGGSGLPASLKEGAVVAISADGDNLIAVDEEGFVHYTKTHYIQFHLTEKKDWSIDHFEDTWTDNWFTIPVVSWLMGRFRDLRLQLSGDYRAFAISQKSPDTAYYTDLSGKRNTDLLVGVTSLYALSSDGSRIFFADPWLHNGFENEVTGPEDGRFIAENLAAGGSTLFLIQRGRDSQGQEIHKMYTRFADHDSIGSHPLFPATFDRENRTFGVNYLPPEDWQEQPEIPLEGQARITSVLTVVVTGRGQNHRQLRVEGVNDCGETGYYYKGVYEPRWRFQRTGHAIPAERFLPPDAPGLQRKEKLTEDYSKGIFVGDDYRVSRISLKGFMRQGLNERGLHTYVEITLKTGEKWQCRLFAHRGIEHFLGARNHKPYWKLLVPEEYYENEVARLFFDALFHGKKAIGVSVEELPEAVVIRPGLLERSRFELHFS